MSRDVASWRITGRDALRRAEHDGATVHDVARAAGVSANTMRNGLAAAGWLILRRPLDVEGMHSSFGVRFKNRRVVFVAEVARLHAAMEKRSDGSVSLESVCGMLGVPVTTVPRLRSMLADYRKGVEMEAREHWGSYDDAEKARLHPVVPLPGAPYAVIRCEPMRDEHHYKRRDSTPRRGGVANSRQLRKELKLNTAQMIHRYDKLGHSLREVAEEAGASPATVARRLREYGIPLRTIGAPRTKTLS